VAALPGVMIRGETTVATAVAVVPIEFFAVTVHDAGTSGAVNTTCRDGSAGS
jgi:hypothetical protein